MGSVTPNLPNGQIKIAIDRGGTFTDVWASSPNKPDVVMKLLSVDPGNYQDAPTEGIRRVLSMYGDAEIPRGIPLPKENLAIVRMGTTVATNALLERKGRRHALLVTKGFRDLLRIGYQSRPKLFDLNISKPEVLFSEVREIDERVTIEGFDEDIDGTVRTDVNEIPGVLVRGSSGDLMRILKPLDEISIRTTLQELRQGGIDTVAVCFTHSHIFGEHERRVGKLAQEAGFNHVSLSSAVAAKMIKMIPRGSSASADAYLTPEIKDYLRGFVKGFSGGHLDDVKCDFMQSDGGLVNHKGFSGLKGILSGPAGKPILTVRLKTPIVAFDMGGTSTDVSRFGGVFEHVFESTTAGVTIQSPQLDINTVAAGGGSILTWRNGLFTVGPESASSHPGPACYRKGGPLTVTDANLFLGRLIPDLFPKIFGKSEKEALDSTIVSEKFKLLTASINVATRKSMSPEEIAFGYLDVANEAMCRPIRSLTEGKGYEIGKHRLGVFGGAGGQHACEIAVKLGIQTVVIHKYSSILSAYGMALADVVHEEQEPTNEVYGKESKSRLDQRIERLRANTSAHLLKQGIQREEIYHECYLNMRYQGTETPVMVLRPDDGDYEAEFLRTHLREFSFVFPTGKPIMVDDARVRGVGRSGTNDGDGKRLGYELQNMKFFPVLEQQVERETRAYFKSGGEQTTPVYRLERLSAGTSIMGPAMIIDNTQTLVIIPDAEARILTSHVVIDINATKEKGTGASLCVDAGLIVDPIQLSVFGHRFMSIAEQMGRTLQKTAVSLNIKERLDFSCAIFGPDAGLVANAPHIPVHLGSMSYAVQYQHELYGDLLKPGDVLCSNHPESGGTHLPDITVITPVFGQDQNVAFYVAARGHHTDIGGYNGTSMPPDSIELWQEGAQMRSFKLIENDHFDEEGIIKVLLEPGKYPGCNGSRRLPDNISDLKAQVAANNKGATLIRALMGEYTQEVVQLYMRAIQNNAELAVRGYLQHALQTLGPKLQAIDFMDNGSPIRLNITISENGTAVFDFAGTGCEMLSNLNAPPAITYSAIIYTLRLLIGADIPMNQGCLAPITVKLPSGTFLNPSAGPAVCAGNTQTSQRVVDVILKAFRAAAASQGCMNCLGFFGSGGVDADGNPLPGSAFAFGETIAGGSGATSKQHGASGVAIHMTNTRITDPESLEKRYPVILREFCIREGSGGRGVHDGGDGVVRDIECRTPLKFSVITERRVIAPYGLDGGLEGERGVNYWVKRNPDGSERWVNIGPKNMVQMQAGDRCVIHTPGGGGWGVPRSSTLATGAKGEAKAAARIEHVPRAAGSLAAFEEAQGGQH
ncbi:Uncharacterized protein BP5553_08489 [Venustampulla echinocandica]|uniref:5-oxoprolinase n=1 Tax=Venustampulla echinocandica TaxID=2656787 RepID=A0A370TEI2_9HELO|nr:Uncharacterized protein BP5553_08489 [Venustampulla echinocandica]RDL33050.1 Uncharacterized protein BP5553_08489 [Venustampulla echinocandica]